MRRIHPAQGNRRRRIAATLAGAALTLAPFIALAQNFPTKPIRIIVPYAPGGSVDLAARVTGKGLQDGFGQSVVVENRAGAGGAIGLEATVKSVPDGYTLVAIGNGAITASPHLTKLPYDPIKDLSPVSNLVNLPIVVAVNPSLPVKTMADLIALAKAKPGALNYSSNGVNSMAYFAGELLKTMTETQMTHVAYQGAAPASAAIAGGQVQFGFVDSAAAMNLARAGTVRAIAVTDPKRSGIAPEVPTIAESGVPGYAITAWAGMLAPAGTPPAVVSRINAEVNRVLRTPEAREQILKVQMEPAPNTVDEFTRHIAGEYAQLGQVIRQLGIKAE
jgi:tripartite-type tricarboxylate transporter receptor subunit TctC